jgi:hypothetical protein
MPNNITNELTIDADRPEVNRILNSIKSDEYGIGSIDFNKLIPMSAELAIESSSRSDNGLDIYTEFKKINPLITASWINTVSEEDEVGITRGLLRKYRAVIKNDPERIALGEKCYNNIENHGAPSWYMWRIKNWGSKWNAYGFEDMAPFDPDSNRICFYTAWSSVPQVIGKIAEMAPSAALTYRYADEDLGVNIGVLEYRNGKLDREYHPDVMSKEAYKLAADIIGIDPETEEESEGMDLS